MGVLGGDPGREDVVGMVGQVISDEGVEQLGVVREMGGGKSHELTGPGRRCVRRGLGEECVGLVADDCGGDEQQGGPGRLGPFQDVRGGRGVVADQPADQVFDVIGHGLTVERGADDPLTRT